MHVHLCYSGFLVARTNTFLRFVHSRFGLDYTEYIDTTEQHRVTSLQMKTMTASKTTCTVRSGLTFYHPLTEHLSYVISWRILNGKTGGTLYSKI